MEKLLGEDLPPDREQSLRRSYYIFHTELGSLAEFAALLRESELWD